MIRSGRAMRRARCRAVAIGLLTIAPWVAPGESAAWGQPSDAKRVAADFFELNDHLERDTRDADHVVERVMLDEKFYETGIRGATPCLVLRMPVTDSDGALVLGDYDFVVYSVEATEGQFGVLRRRLFPARSGNGRELERGAPESQRPADDHILVRHLVLQPPGGKLLPAAFILNPLVPSLTREIAVSLTMEIPNAWSAGAPMRRVYSATFKLGRAPTSPQP